MTNIVKKKEVSIEYCPAEIMSADFFTNPLQGALFQISREFVMRYKHISVLSNPHENEERIEILAF